MFRTCITSYLLGSLKIVFLGFPAFAGNLPMSRFGSKNIIISRSRFVVLSEIGLMVTKNNIKDPTW